MNNQGADFLPPFYLGAERNTIRRPILIVLLITVLISLIIVSFFPAKTGKLFESEGQIVCIEGLVTSVKYKDYASQIIVKIKGESVLVKIPNIGEENVEKLYKLAGRKVTVYGSISLPTGSRNPGTFNYKQYLKARNIYAICTTNKYKITGGNIVLPLTNLLSTCKGLFYSTFKEYTSEDSMSMLAGVLFGDKGFMDDELIDNFQSIGASHILAVSGLHLNLIAELTGKVLGKKRNKKTDLITMAVVFLYADLSSFSLPVLRAGFMLGVKLLSFHLDRPYDSVSSAALCSAVFLMCNPNLIFDGGTWMSFLAAYSMGIVLPWLSNRTGKLADKFKSEAFYKLLTFINPCIAASLGTMPLIAYSYHSFTPIGFVLNPVIIAITGIFLPFGLISFGLCIIMPKALFTIVLRPIGALLSGITWVVKLLSSTGKLLGLNSDCISPPIGLLILYYAFFFYFFSENRYILRRKEEYRVLSILGAGLLSLGILVPRIFGITNGLNPFSYYLPEVTFVDVGQGDCVHIHMGNYNMLIDGGGAYYSNIAETTLKPYLLANGVNKIDLAIITHDDMDHSKGIKELAEIFPVEKIITNKDIYGETGLSENESCLVISMDIDGLSYLFMADADFTREEALIAAGKLGHFDIIKLGHHGSKTSTSEEFLDTVTPAFAVISVGKNNNYGHPSARVIELLEDSDIIYARTDQMGAISIASLSKGQYLISTSNKDSKWLIQKQQDQLNILQEP